MKSPLRLLLAAALLLTPVLAAPPATADDTKTLSIGISSEGVDSLNPFLAYFSPAALIGRLMYEFLTTTSAKDVQPVGALADKWSYSNDKLTWTYHIRKGVTWSDGKPVTAKDAAFTFNLIMHNPDAAKANGNYVQNFSSVTAKDDQTLVIRTRAPQATMTALRVPIVPEHVWKKIKSIRNYPNDDTPVVGDGPFVLTEYKAGQYATLTANDHYWRGRPKVDRIVFRFYSNSDAAVQSLRKGEVDLVDNLTPAQADKLKGEDNIKLNIAQGRQFVELSMNPGAASTDGTPIGDGNPALRDVRVRQALSYAIDRKALVDKVLGGYAQPGDGYIPKLYSQYHWTPAKSERRDFDIDKANQILDAAGYKRDSGGTRHMPGGGKALNLRFLGHAETPLEGTIGNYLKSWFGRLGIGLDVKLVSGTKLNTDLPNGQYDLVMGGWNVNADPDSILHIQTCSARPEDPKDPTSSSTDDYWCDKKFDQLYAQQLRTFDPAPRAALIKQMQKIYYDQVPSDILYYPNTLEAYRTDRFKPFTLQPDPGGQILMQQADWGLYEANPQPSSGGNTAVTVVKAIVGVAIVVALGFVAVALRRRQTADDRE
ncbi:MAG TPA: ABC transporter substrate-binding protein [Mycobacteriales bacterium]|nr:ABC transporter substrate-binding protein [Mycobacteriales bacterium]